MIIQSIDGGVAIISRRCRCTFGGRRKRQRRRRQKHQTFRLCIRYRRFVHEARCTTFLRHWKHLTPFHFLTQTQTFSEITTLTSSRVSNTTATNKRRKCCCQSWLKSGVRCDHFRCCRDSISLRNKACVVVVVVAVVLLHVGLVHVLHLLLSSKVHTTKDVPIIVV